MRFRELLLSPNKYSRPQAPMGAVLALVMHYTQSPRSSAENIRDYFESLKSGVEKRWASAHYAVDEDEAVLMVPHGEVAYHCGSGSDYPIGYTAFAVAHFGDYPNAHAIGVEMCHRDATGAFDRSTLDNARGIAATVCARYDLNPMTQILRHYDITGKHCPLWWVQYPTQFDTFREQVKETMIRARERGASEVLA